VLEGLGSDLGDGKAIANGFVGGVPSSFTSQIAYATGGIRRRGSPHGSQDMLNKLVLARMNNIEEGFREVIKEAKDLRTSETIVGLMSNGLPSERNNGRTKRRNPQGLERARRARELVRPNRRWRPTRTNRI
jgi:hypothetical protein